MIDSLVLWAYGQEVDGIAADTGRREGSYDG
jgi:hypothetical protein